MCKVVEVRAQLQAEEGDFFSLFQRLGGALQKQGVVLSCFAGYQVVGNPACFRLKVEEEGRSYQFLKALVEAVSLGAARNVEVCDAD